MQIEITFTGLKEAIEKFAGLETAIVQGIPQLFRIMGAALVDNVKTRIIRRDNGSWAPASKWAKAKTGYEFPTLLGAEKYVRMTQAGYKLSIYGSTPKGWTLTQHHEGFENKLIDKDEIVDDHGRVTLNIKDAGPLNLYQEFRRTRAGATKPVATVFLFVPQKPGVTPARKIWPTLGEAEAVGQPIASRWLEQIVREQGIQ